MREIHSQIALIDLMDAEMLPGLCNFMLFGKDVIIQNPKYIEMAVDIFLTSLSHDHLTEHDAVNGFRIAEALLLGYKGHVDSVRLFNFFAFP